MDQKKENAQKYKSSSTGNPCTAAQYIAELVCTRKRNKDNTGSLPYKFWNNSHKEEYEIQIRVANKIIKKYGEEALMHFLNKGSGTKTYSLGFLHSSKKFVLISKFVENGILESVKIIEEQSSRPKKIIEVTEDGLTYTKRTKKNNNTLLNKIRKAENGN